jgi:Domain of unknown function (DUF4209)
METLDVVMNLRCLLVWFMSAARKRSITFGVHFHTAMSIEDRFPFVHPSIAEIIDCQSHQYEAEASRTRIDPQSLKILCEPMTDTIARQDLIELAHASDAALFDGRFSFPWTLPLHGLLDLSHENVAAATLLALNSLESAIRRRAGYVTGKAPLLKTMIHQLDDDQLKPIFKSLLLPHEGLNLRNLLWHGFVPSLPRPWFALVFVLLRNLEPQQQDHDDSHDHPQPVVIPDLRSQPSLKILLEDPIEDTDLSRMRSWLPLSHQSLFDLAMQWIDCYPTCATALLGILLEHGLRVEWCHVNNRPHDCIAQPGAYYVTLDGHGQRDRHDLLLHPYYQQCQPNHLISHLGGSTHALLTDLFASACGGPNIRAALAHGMWDAWIETELGCRITGTKTMVGDEPMKDMVQIMMVALKCVAIQTPFQYTPLYSYTATTRCSLDTTLEGLCRLELLRETFRHQPIFEQARGPISHELMDLHVPVGKLRQVSANLPFFTSRNTKSQWTTADVYDDYECNVALANCIAAKTLLSDIGVAICSYCELLEEVVDHLKCSDSATTRQQRRSIRLVSMVDVTLSLYSFVTRVALLWIESKLLGTTDLSSEVLLKGVERSRMCVSTFATFLPTNAERATKSAVEFSKGKATKAIYRHMQQETEIIASKEF